ncbi:GyrI-like domain-containing protein [Roseobacteraceae bacterium NS-SX3]
MPPLQALWEADDPSAFTSDDRAAWRWTVMLRMPDAVTAAAVEQARAAALGKQAKKKADGAILKLLETAELQPLHEGRCLQCLHIGPYADEAPVLAHLHEAEMPERGLTFNGPHHEIYLSDTRRTAPERLKTLLRQPVKPA